MQREEAMQCALGYAWGREDASGVATVATVEHGNGAHEYASAFAAGYDDYNAERRGYMTNTRDAYETWQASGGAGIFRDELAARE